MVDDRNGATVMTATAEMTTKRIQQIEALNRAENGASTMNYVAIFEGFAEKGIDEDDIEPRENVFTYNAWQAKGRQVKRGEHGVKCITWIVGKKRDKKTGEEKAFKFAKTVTVFHVSQTEKIK
jgi:hypothetical protein